MQSFAQLALITVLARLRMACEAISKIEYQTTSGKQRQVITPADVRLEDLHPAERNRLLKLGEHDFWQVMADDLPQTPPRGATTKPRSPVSASGRGQKRKIVDPGAFHGIVTRGPGVHRARSVTRAELALFRAAGHAANLPTGHRALPRPVILADGKKIKHSWKGSERLRFEKPAPLPKGLKIKGAGTPSFRQLHKAAVASLTPKERRALKRATIKAAVDRKNARRRKLYDPKRRAARYARHLKRVAARRGRR
jgi:hypothetical protein